MCVSDACEVHSKPFSQQRRNTEFRGIAISGGNVAVRRVRVRVRGSDRRCCCVSYRATDTRTGHVGGGCSASGAAHGPLSVLRRRRGRPSGAHGVRRSVRRCQGALLSTVCFDGALATDPPQLSPLPISTALPHTARSSLPRPTLSPPRHGWSHRQNAKAR